MSKNVIHRAFANLYHRLTRGNFGAEKWKKQFAYFGEGTRVDWPANINVGGGRCTSVIKRTSCPVVE